MHYCRNETGPCRYRHSDERFLVYLWILGRELWIGLSRLHVEASKAQRPADEEKKGNRPPDLMQLGNRSVTPGVSQQRRSDAKRKHIGDRVQLHSKLCRCPSHSGDAAVQRVEKICETDIYACAGKV